MAFARSSSSKTAAGSPVVLAQARRYLRFGNRSVHEVRMYLARRGVADRVIQRVCEIFVREGALDDRLAARLTAQSWADRGYARQAITQRLAARGFQSRDIQQAVASLRDDADEATRLLALARARLARRAPAGTHAKQQPVGASRARVAGWLSRRGFDAELIDRALSDLLGPSSE